MKELTLEITNCCTGFCSWCSASAVAQYGKHMSYQMAFKLLEKYRGDCDVVRISGGEPTTHPKFIMILGRAKELGYRVILLTNGRNIRDVICTTLVDEYVVHVIADYSIEAVSVLRYLRKSVSLHAVLVKGNEGNILNAIKCSFANSVPLRLLTLQRQGGAKIGNYLPLTLLSWTGDKGCDKENKITIAHDGRVTTCSALKGKTVPGPIHPAASANT